MKVATRDPRLGDFIQAETDTHTGYCRKVIAVTEAAETVYKIGRVIGDGDDTAAAADAFQGFFIGTPDGKNSVTVPAATPTDIVILYRGPCTVGRDLMVYAADVDSQPEIDAKEAQMEAAGFKIQAQPNQFA